MIIAISLIVAVIGLILYYGTGPKTAEIGRIMFFCGLLSFLIKMADPMLRIM